MKALTVHPLEALLITLGIKRVETRSWWTCHRGPLAIHASAEIPRENRDAMRHPTIKALLRRAGYESWIALPTRKVLCVTSISHVVTTDYLVKRKSHPAVRSVEYLVGDYRPGRYMWILGLVQPLATPVEVIGKLGLWDIDLEVPDVRQ